MVKTCKHGLVYKPNLTDLTMNEIRCLFLLKIKNYILIINYIKLKIKYEDISFKI